MALCHKQLYQKRIKNAFDKKARLRVFKEGDLVLKKILPNSRDRRGKWSPHYEGLYVVKHTFSRGALILTNADGRDLKYHVNADSVKLTKEKPEVLIPDLYGGGVRRVRHKEKRY
ncbi:hypothetical protein CR513_06523, partial [Mucuna pruriens]